MMNDLIWLLMKDQTDWVKIGFWLMFLASLPTLVAIAVLSFTTEYPNVPGFPP